MKRDRFQCTYCGVAGTDAELEIDHIIPVASGGSHHISNLTTSCRSCNQKKGAGIAPIMPKPNSSHPIIGMWLHTYKDGKIDHQGQILAVDGESVLIQLYEWFAGTPGRVDVMTKEALYSKDCTLYPTNEHMQEAYLRYAHQHLDE